MKTIGWVSTHISSNKIIISYLSFYPSTSVSTHPAEDVGELKSILADVREDVGQRRVLSVLLPLDRIRKSNTGWFIQSWYHFYSYHCCSFMGTVVMMMFPSNSWFWDVSWTEDIWNQVKTSMNCRASMAIIRLRMVALASVSVHGRNNSHPYISQGFEPAHTLALHVSMCGVVSESVRGG